MPRWCALTPTAARPWRRARRFVVAVGTSKTAFGAKRRSISRQPALNRSKMTVCDIGLLHGLAVRVSGVMECTAAESLDFDIRRLGHFRPLIDLRSDQDAQFFRRRTYRIDPEGLHFCSELRRVDHRADIGVQYFQDRLGNTGWPGDERNVARTESGVGFSDGRSLGRFAQAIGARCGDQL